MNAEEQLVSKSCSNLISKTQIKLTSLRSSFLAFDVHTLPSISRSGHTQTHAPVPLLPLLLTEIIMPRRARPQGEDEQQPRRRTTRDGPHRTTIRTTMRSTLPRTTLLVLSYALLATAASLEKVVGVVEHYSARQLRAASPENVVGEVEHYSARQLREILDLPITYGRYMPPWLNDNYEQAYAQAPAGSTWTDPAQSGLNRPGWTKYLAEYAQGRAGEFSPPALRYTSDDLYAVSSW